MATRRRIGRGQSLWWKRPRIFFLSVILKGRRDACMRIVSGARSRELWKEDIGGGADGRILLTHLRRNRKGSGKRRFSYSTRDMLHNGEELWMDPMYRQYGTYGYPLSYVRESTRPHCPCSYRHSQTRYSLKKKSSSSSFSRLRSSLSTSRRTLLPPSRSNSSHYFFGFDKLVTQIKGVYRKT